MKKSMINLAAISATMSQETESTMMNAFAHLQSVLFWEEAVMHIQTGIRGTQFWERNYKILSLYTIEAAVKSLVRIGRTAVQDLCVLNSMVRQECGEYLLTEKLNREDPLLAVTLAQEVEEQYQKLTKGEFREVCFPRTRAQ